jgi:hypothetical protein
VSRPWLASGSSLGAQCSSNSASFCRNKQVLPAWAVQSTVTGQQTELGVKHDKLQQVRAEREARSLLGQEDVKVDTTDAGELSSVLLWLYEHLVQACSVGSRRIGCTLCTTLGRRKRQGRCYHVRQFRGQG